MVRVRDTRLGKLFRSRTRLAGWDRQVPGEYKWVGRRETQWGRKRWQDVRKGEAGAGWG